MSAATDPQDQASSASRETRLWRDRANGLNPETARKVLSDPILNRLDAVQFGVVLRLHAMTRAGSPLTSRLKVASKLLGLTPKRLAEVLLDLQTLSPGLISEEAGCLVCDALVNRQYVPHSDKRSASAKTRWAAERGLSDSEGDGPVSEATFNSQPSQTSIKPAGAVGFRRLHQVNKAGEQGAGAVQGEDLALAAAPRQGALFFDPQAAALTLEAEQQALAKRAPPCPYKEIVDLFNSICVSLTRVQQPNLWTSSGRRSSLERRWKEHPGLDTWKAYFERIEKSTFLTGRQASPWRADFDWILKPSNMDRILEGVYDNRPGGRQLWNKGAGATAAPQESLESVIDESAPFLAGASTSKGGQQ